MAKRLNGDVLPNGKRAKPDAEQEQPISSPSPQLSVCSSASPDTSLAYIPNSETAWQTTVSKVVQSVVSIHFMQPANFDTEAALVSEATGFVVDAPNGIILTNRHVVGPGPFVGYAVFDNHEEVTVSPIYRDPVHDFGFLKFDPADLKYMNISSLALCPEKARVGEEIRVIGNDSGEKLSILAGFISRLDRNAPDYGPQSYNDFNTEYIQAAASASGGSSGSPVVNILGETVALQAGGSTESSTDFFLPVWRVKRALECVQQNLPVTRGTIQVQWTLAPFDKCRRLGLTSEVEGKVRSLSRPGREVNGMLVCGITIPGGPATNSIIEGDCLVSINGKLITSFVEVDEILDANVGRAVDIVVQRSGVDVAHSIVVGDLHEITPNRYLEACGATFNELSYQLARIYGIPVGGVYVANAAGSFQLGSAELTNSWIIDSIDNKPTPDLDTFVKVMMSIPDKAFVPVQYHHLTDIHVPLFKDTFIDRHWSKPLKMATRNDATGLWDFEVLQKEPLAPLAIEPKSARFMDIPTEYPNCKPLSKSFVQVEATYEIPLDSFSGHIRRIYGVVIDAAQGLVLVSRHCIAHDLCDVNITIAESVIVPAKVLFLHPTKGYAIVKYDPSLVNAPVTTPSFDNRPLDRGDKVLFIGHGKNMRPIIDETKIMDVGLMNVPTNSNAPKYKATNVEAVVLDSSLGQKCSSGVICDRDTGAIRAIWLACDGEDDKLYTTGVNVSDIMWELEDLISKGESPNVRLIEAEMGSLSLANARINGVPESYIMRIEETAKDKYQFLYVTSIAVGLHKTDRAASLVPGDVLLEANDRLITRYRDIEDMIRQTPQGSKLRMKVVRGNALLDILVELKDSVRDDEMFVTKKLLSWSGCVFQCPPQGVRQVINNLPSQIYCTTMAPGSPGRFYSVGITNFITHVNDIPVATVSDMHEQVKKVADGQYVKIRVVTFDQIPMAMTLKVCYHYFPTTLMVRENGVWKSLDDK